MLIRAPRRKFLYSKKYFWFGADAVDPKDLSSYLKAEKVAEVGHSVAAWAAETGKGLLFYSEKPGEKSSPHGAIQLVCGFALSHSAIYF